MNRFCSSLALFTGLLAACSNDDTAQAVPAGEAPAVAPAPASLPAAAAAPSAAPTPVATPTDAVEAQPTPVAIEGQAAPAAIEGQNVAPVADAQAPSVPAEVPGTTAAPVPVVGQWVSLFNGVNLDGWTIKMTHHALNDNYLDTFRVEDGLLRVVYADYGPFGGEFGHLFYTGANHVFSYYRLRIEYRILGQQVAGGPDWGYRNNGVMIHSQTPESMGLDQDFPTSMEVQFLGSDEGAASLARPTGNVCSPGTNIVLAGQLHTEHCVLTSSTVIRGEQWVTIEVEVRGSESVKHVVNGQVTVSYTNPQYDPNDPSAQTLIQSNDLMLREGMIALQAESHPTDFRKVEIMLLDPATPSAFP